MTKLTRSTSETDSKNLGSAENLAFSESSVSTCPVCGDPLCPHGVCRKAEPEYACEACLDPYSVVLDAMKYISVVSGPAMGAAEYRAFMAAMKIFSQATKEIARVYR